MKSASTIIKAIEQLDATVQHRKNAVYPNIDKLRQFWAQGQQRGKIVIIDSPQPGDGEGVRSALIVTTDDGLLIRIEITKPEGVNLSRAIIDSVT